MRCGVYILFVWLLAPIWGVAASAQVVMVGQFSEGALEGWKNKKFKGETQYSFVKDSVLQKQVLKAVSQGAASGLFFKKRINIEQTPWLHWSWKAEQLMTGINENDKAGDDYVARIYVVIDGGVFFWRTVALNYVWSSSHQKGEQWDNPYTSNTQMFAVESGNENVGQWQYYKRNVREDLRDCLAKDVKYIDAIAIMTDTDNSGLRAINLFGDIYFTSE